MSGEFDRFTDDYEAALARGLSVSGEDKLHFARERIAFLASCLRELGASPEAVLDFGCGTGDATPILLRELGVSRVVGLDRSARSLARARERHGAAKVTFVEAGAFVPHGDLPLAYCNGVFHHIPEAERVDAVRSVHDALRPGGYFALWENNPWNPGARFVMWRIPFDRDAVMLSARGARRALVAGGFEIVRTDHLFVFPRALRGLRFLESHLRAAPLGAQYQVLARKPLRDVQGGGASR
jgi:SAM-dependent methyltransferase